MNLLILSTNTSPNRASFRLRIAVNIPYLEQAGIRCHVEQIPKSYIARWKLYGQSVRYDGVLLHRKSLTLIDAKILRRFSRKIILDYDDAIMFNPRKSFWSRHKLMKRFAQTAKISDMIIAGNEYLAEIGHQFCDNIKIVPTGLDVHKFDPFINDTNSDKIRLVWIGSRSTLRYLKQLKPVLEKIGHKYPNVILRIISDEFFDLENMAVEKVIWNQDSQYADLATGHIGLAPLTDDVFARGKCGFKILQYFAASLPCVTSPVGVNAEYVSQGQRGYHADTQKNWLEKLCELIEDKQLRESMGSAARQYSETFDHSIIGKELASQIKKALGD